MKRAKKHFVFFVCLLLSLQNSFAGEPLPAITGKVTAETGEPLAGVSVAPKDNSASGTTTNENGAFSINAPAGTKILVFSYVGFGTQEVDITGLTTVDVQLKAETNSLESIVVTGYQAIKKKDLLGAVSVVDVKDVKLNSSGNPLKGMQGRTAGIYVTADGSPAGRASVMVRGATTISRDPGNATDPAVAPLYIVDGVPMNSGFYNLSANDIESIQVLKDPSSASIYGSRAANGVIIVTTKGAEKKDGKVEFNSFMSSQRFTTPYSVLNAEERGRVLWQATMNDNKSTGTNTDPNANPIYDYEWHTDANGNPVLDRVIIPEWVDESKGIRSADTDWWDVISRPGFTQNYDLAFSKAGKTGSSRFSVNYYKNKGILKGTDFERITARLNSNFTILNGKVRVGENLSVAKGNESPTPGSVGGNVIDLALISQPILPIYTVNGGWAGPPGAGFDDRDNPYHAIVDNGLDQNQFLTVAGNAFAEVSILKNLIFRTNFGVEYTDQLNRDIEKKFIAGFLGSNINSLQLSQGHNVTWTWNNTLTYTLEKGRSNLSAFVGTETVKEQFTNFFTRREGFALETLDFMTIDAGTGTQTVGSWQNGRNFGAGGFQLQSYFGKVNYTWDERFLVSGTVRYDGSSRFGKENKYGLFPSISAGWRLNNEKFFSNALPFFSDFKIRAGYGVTGNQNQITNDATFNIYKPNYGEDNTWGPNNGTSYDITGTDGGNLPSGFQAQQRANPNLKWESTTGTNVGIDFGLFDQKISGSFDVFEKNTKDILISADYNAVIGDGGRQWVNAGELKNRGFEAVVNYRGIAGPVQFNIAANYGFYKDKVTYVPDVAIPTYPFTYYENVIGHSQYSFTGYIADGIFKTQDEVEKHATQLGAGVGRIRYRDIDGNGEITDRDQAFIGVSTPRHSFGVSINATFMNFDFSIFVQGVSDVHYNNYYKVYTDMTNVWNGSNFGKRTLSAWTPENPDSPIPAVTLVNNNNESRSSTYFVENGRYIKGRNANLGYTFPNRFFGNKIDRLRLYVQAENMFIIKDRKGLDQSTVPDPETPNSNYPVPFILTGGINLQF